jgi:hypothetical protein
MSQVTDTGTRTHEVREHPDREATRRRLRRLAHVLDTAVPLPGGYRVGVDGLIGLVPGIGDLTGTALSSYIVAEAHRLGVPTVVVMRMVLNVLIESAVGIVPVAGDLFDFVWKANRRNVQLLEEHMERPDAVKRQSGLVVAGLTAGIIAAAVLLVVLIVWLIGLVLSAL